MASPQVQPKIIKEIELIQQERRSLFLMGLLFVVLAIAVFLAPQIILVPIVILFSLGFITSGVLKLIQLHSGQVKLGKRQRGVILILLHSAIDIAAGIVLLTNSQLGSAFVTLVLALVFIADGSLQLAVAWQSRGVRARLLFLLNALFTLTLGIGTIFLIRQEHVGWLTLLIAIRFLSFAFVLFSMSLRSRNGTLPVVFREIEPSVVRRQRGELYACYFGAGFHLGVYIGNNEVVHYRDDSIVHRTSWEEFLRGREPQHWIYPDIDPAPVDVVIKTAIAEAGKKMKYNLITNNCENFAIYCKTGGKKRTSKYAQTTSALTNLKHRPFVAIFVEAYMRAGEWIAFHFGGTFGHKVSYRIRRFNSMVTAWMLATKASAPEES